MTDDFGSDRALTDTIENDVNKSSTLHLVQNVAQFVTNYSGSVLFRAIASLAVSCDVLMIVVLAKSGSRGRTSTVYLVLVALADIIKVFASAWLV